METQFSSRNIEKKHKLMLGKELYIRLIKRTGGSTTFDLNIARQHKLLLEKELCNTLIKNYQ